MRTPQLPSFQGSIKFDSMPSSFFSLLMPSASFIKLRLRLIIVIAIFNVASGSMSTEEPGALDIKLTDCSETVGAVQG